MLNNAMRGKVKLTKTILLTAICFSQGQVHLWNFELEFLFRKKYFGLYVAQLLVKTFLWGL